MSTAYCQMFCKGKSCKWEDYTLWLDDVNHPNAIAGLFSNWITDSILAMQRPSSRLIAEFELIEVFRRKGITAVLNLQERGEHAHCGDGITDVDGFSYRPEEFMDHGIFYFNMGWKDMSAPKLPHLLDCVQVMASTQANGGKTAVHCHAGLGRTGLVIACYLIYGQNMTPEKALATVRGQRPLCVQTRRQQQCLQNFAVFLEELRLVYPSNIKWRWIEKQPFDVAFTIARQRILLHGDERELLRFVPKLVVTVVRRMIALHRYVGEVMDVIRGSLTCSDPLRVEDMQLSINAGQWDVVEQCTSLADLFRLLSNWLSLLDEPLISDHLADTIFNSGGKENEENYVNVIRKMPKHIFYTIAVIVRMASLCEIKNEQDLKDAILPALAEIMAKRTGPRATLLEPWLYFVSKNYRLITTTLHGALIAIRPTENENFTEWPKIRELESESDASSGENTATTGNDGPDSAVEDLASLKFAPDEGEINGDDGALSSSIMSPSLMPGSFPNTSSIDALNL